MSMTDVDPSSAPSPDGGGGGGGPPAPQGGGGGGAPPPGGGPILAALARQRQQPPVSAPGPGNMAQGLMQIKTAVDMMQSALPNLAPGSQQHKDVLNALNRLSRHLPQGAPTAGVQQTQLGDLLRSTIRNALMQKLMGQKGAAGAPTGPPQGGGGGDDGGDQAPPPSTPMPGA